MSVEDELGNLIPKELCWSALARVVDDEPTFVFADGDANGMTVECMVLTGPFQGATVAAMVSSPLGVGFDVGPIRAGQRLLLHFLDGTLDGEIVAGAVVPGGAANKIPTAVAGVKVDEAGLDQMRVIAPPKGTGIRYYVRGSQFVVRLKGAQKDFVGEFFVEGDDGAAPNSTAIRMALDPTSGKLGVKIRDAAGAYVQIGQGAAVLSSANGENKIEVTDEGVSIMGTVVTIAGDQLTDIHGGAVLLNMPTGVPPVPGVSSVAQGPGAPLNTFSATVHVGP